MLRTLFCLAALVASATTAQAAERRYAISDFDRIIVEGPYSVRLVVGRSSSAMASGTQQGLDGVSVEVQGTTLRVRRNRNAWGGYPGRPAESATITLTTRNFRSARLLGAGSLDVQGAKGLKVDFAVEGSGRLSATALEADNLSLIARGSGTLRLQGSAKTLSADIQGSSSLDGAGLRAETATIVAATSGDVSLSARRAATITANGLGSIAVDGQPACTLRGPGAANVRCGSSR